MPQKDVNTLLGVILVALCVGFALGRYFRTYVFQNRGEALLSRATRTHFRSPDYHLMNHITLQVSDGTTQIDHILISRFGVFVIETKHYTGWIFGNAKHAVWTQVQFRRKFTFRNPIFQNQRHVRAVQDLLDFLPPGIVQSAVVFTGEAEFKTEVPMGVFGLSGFIEYVQRHSVEVMSLNRLQFCVGRLESARLAVTEQTDIEHVQGLERRYGSDA